MGNFDEWLYKQYVEGDPFKEGNSSPLLQFQVSEKQSQNSKHGVWGARAPQSGESPRGLTGSLSKKKVTELLSSHIFLMPLLQGTLILLSLGQGGSREKGVGAQGLCESPALWNLLGLTSQGSHVAADGSGTCCGPSIETLRTVGTMECA